MVLTLTVTVVFTVVSTLMYLLAVLLCPGVDKVPCVASHCAVGQSKWRSR